MDRPRWMQPVKTTRIPQCCIFADTETLTHDTSNPAVCYELFRLGTAASCRRVGGRWAARRRIKFDDVPSFWKWLESHLRTKSPTWLFMHNAGFDLTILDFWSRLDNGSFRTLAARPVGASGGRAGKEARKPWRGQLVISDPPTIIVCRHKRGTLKIVDTMNYFRTSLKAMGQSVGLDKLPPPPRDASEDDWAAYCFRDVEILERTVCGMLDRWERDDCGCWQTTAASLAWAAFKRTLADKSILIDQDELHTPQARAAYFGARAEPYYIGPVYPRPEHFQRRGLTLPADYFDRPRGPAYYLDVRSLYPSVMRDNPFPVAFVGVEPAPSVERLIRKSKVHLPIATVELDTRGDTYPLREPGQLIFPTGNYVTTLAAPELDRALSRGHVVRVQFIAWYLPGFPFRRFVDQWFARRMECERKGDVCGAALCKLVLNSLAGKFGQRRSAWRDVFGEAPLFRFGQWHRFDRDTRELSLWRSIGGHVQLHQGGGESRESYPAISAFINSYGREVMHRHRERCPDRSVIYQDTDSLIVTQSGYDALHAADQIGGDELGRLREVDVWDCLDVLGLKNYVTPAARVAAGVKKDAAELEPGRYVQTRFQRLADLARGYDGPRVRVETVGFSGGGGCHPRVAGPDGWTLPPHRHRDDAPF